MYLQHVLSGSSLKLLKLERCKIAKDNVNLKGLFKKMPLWRGFTSICNSLISYWPKVFDVKDKKSLRYRRTLHGHKWPK